MSRFWTGRHLGMLLTVTISGRSFVQCDFADAPKTPVLSLLRPNKSTAEVQQLWEISSKNPDDLVLGISDSVKRAWKTACRLAGVEDFRLHDCRHTATTRMIASGSPHTEVKKITGHSQLKTFLRYLNITTEVAERVADRLEMYLMDNRLQVQQVSEQVN